jgi:serine/threonine protein kinase
MVAERISHYQIVRKLGSGGMGEVFEAEDTQLRRRVALKVLPEAMASNKETLDRFRREARALAALNHPNIVTVYSVEEAGGQHFLTMELVQGKPLTEVIPKQGLEMAEFSHLAIPLADALAAAHEKGIAHRDLKPSNVMVTDRGSVKVIDFGLAKLVERKGGNGGGDETTRLQTMEGRILGTPAYMSPEQIEGKPLDPRTDIFSLGVMLCEMTTGKRPFKGDTPMSVMSAVLKDPAPPVRDLKPNLPPGLGRIIHRCLEKDPAKRYQTASALRTDLLDLSDTTKTIQAAAPESSAVGMGRRWLPWIVLGSAAVVMVLFLLPKTPTGQENRAAQAQPRVGGASQSASNQPLIMRLSPSRQITYETGIEDWPSFAPDGNRIIYAAEANGFKSLVIRSLKTGENTQLPRTNRDEIMPAWNPANQEEIVFVRHTAPGGKLEVTDVYGGSSWEAERCGSGICGRGRRFCFPTERSILPSLRTAPWRFTVSRAMSCASGPALAMEAGWSSRRVMTPAQSTTSNRASRRMELRSSIVVRRRTGRASGLLIWLHASSSRLRSQVYTSNPPGHPRASTSISHPTWAGVR